MAPEPNRWVHKVLEWKPKKDSDRERDLAAVEEFLNRYGVEGWELVFILPRGSGLWLVMRTPFVSDTPKVGYKDRMPDLGGAPPPED